MEMADRRIPQVFMGQSDKIEVKGKEASVTFILARGGYERGAVEAMGKFLIRTFQFFTKLFGPLSGNEMHIAASSAGMGGHGAFLGTFLDIQSFQKKIDESKSDDFFDETAAHELAHSWWGILALTAEERSSCAKPFVIMGPGSIQEKS